VNVILESPFEARLILLFLIGAVLGSFVNLVVDRLREETPRYSPWNGVLDRLFGRHQPPSPKREPTPEPRRKLRGSKQPRVAEKRQPSILALLPVVGWLEAAVTAPPPRQAAASLQDATSSGELRPRGFWVRPMMVELGFALTLVLLYWWEIGRWGMIPFLPGDLNVPLEFQAAMTPQLRELMTILHLQFAAHAIFLTFMLAASLIDLDEWVIPDAIAVTGTLVALGWAVLAPSSRLFELIDEEGWSVLLHLATPGHVPAKLAAGEAAGLALALACAWLWCFGQLPRVWTLRWGWRTALGLFFRRLARDRAATLRILGIGVAVSVLCAMVWSYGGDARWTALLSALVGLTVGSGIVWVIRIVCSTILQREAMGFGDVTLMAMIGAFLGWQPTLCAFFLSPFFGLIPPIVALMMRAGAPRAVPYGPFLCLGATTVLLLWADMWPLLWSRLTMFDEHGAGLVLIVIGGALVVLVLLLLGLQAIKRAFA
jgi:prepilin signal peptidase PulO-like enzyme (type II secretory pathway)